MRFILSSILIIAISAFVYGQDTLYKMNLPAKVYFVKDSLIPLIIYDKVEGKAVDTLLNSNEKYCWYQLEIKDAENGWLQIENLLQIPGCEPFNIDSDNQPYRNYWVEAENFMVDMQGYHEVSLYASPNLNADVLFKSSAFIRCHVIDASENWLKVWFMVEDKKMIGWLNPNDYCGHPWTTCAKGF